MRENNFEKISGSSILIFFYRGWSLNESQNHRGPMVESRFFEPPREARIDSLTEESE